MEKEVQKTSETKNVKLYSVFAYIGILWIVGLLVKEKDNKTVKFHVGQGMLVTLLNVVISVINNAIISNIFVTTEYIFGVAYKSVSGLGLAIEGVLSLIPLVLMIIGIVNAAKDKEEELPVIGKFAFYK